MTISTIALDLHHQQPQPRNEPPYSRPRRSPRLKRSGGVSSIRSPRHVTDVDLTVKATTTTTTNPANSVRPLHLKENVEVELGTVSQTRERVVLTEVEEFLVTNTVSRLSRPAWPRSTPTIPSSLFKNDFQTKVKTSCVY